MNRLKKSYIHFLFFSFFITVPGTVCVANPGQEDLPPLPPDQDKPFFEPPKLPPKDSDSIIHYRGNRIYMNDYVLEVEETNLQRIDEDTVSLEISFNQSINPRSVGYESIFIDNEPLPPETRFFFNRRGDTIRIFVQMEDDYFLLSIQDIYSFDGKLIEPVDFDMSVPIQEDLEDEEKIEQQEDENPLDKNIPENDSADKDNVQTNLTESPVLF